jgi:hypothetical protein
MRRLEVDECLNATDLRGGPFDGCFIDRANFGLQMLANYKKSAKVPKGFTPAEVEGLASGGQRLLGQLQAAVGSTRYILAKEHMGEAGCGDGAYVNSIMANDGLCSVYSSLQPSLYNRSGLWYDPAACMVQLECLLRTVKRGQLTQSRAMGPLVGVPSAQARGNETFTLAAFLSIAGEHSYFSYASNSAHDSYDMYTTPWLAQYDRKLGAPLGLATRGGVNGSVFTRRFEHVNVSFSALEGKAELCWSDGQCDVATPAVAT